MRERIRRQAHEIGGRTLEVFAQAPRVTQWMFSQLAAGVHGDVLEIGSGIGNVSELIRARARHLTVSDTESEYLSALSERFRGDSNVEIAHYDLDHPPPHAVAKRRYDAIVAINVIEHIADDGALVRHLSELLRPGGNLLIYVPACPFAYGSLDVKLGHYRRYTPQTLARLLRGAALDASAPRYVNLLGLGGWLWNCHVLRRTYLSERSISLFDKLVPLVRLEDKLRLPIGLGLCTRAAKPARVTVRRWSHVDGQVYGG